MSEVNGPTAADDSEPVASPVSSPAPGAPGEADAVPLKVTEDSSKPIVELATSAVTSTPPPPASSPSPTQQHTHNYRDFEDDLEAPRRRSNQFSDTYRSASRDRTYHHQPGGLYSSGSRTYSSSRVPPPTPTSKYSRDSSASYRTYDSRTQSAYTSYGGAAADYDPDYTSRLLAAASGSATTGYSPSTVLRSDNVADNIRFHPIIDQNKPEAPVNKKLSTRSRQVMLQGYEMGFTSPALKTLYDVCHVILKIKLGL